MSSEEDKELEQLQKLDKLRKLIQTILGGHLTLLFLIFLLVLASVLAIVVLSVTNSPRRYLARLNLCYLPKQKGKISHYDEKYVLDILKRQTTRRNFSRQVDAETAREDETDSDAQDGKSGRSGKHKLSKSAQLKRLAARQIKIIKVPRQAHNFAILLNAASEEDAVELINEFAQVCIQEYTKERTRDLRNRKNVLENEREGVKEKIKQCNTKISQLVMPLNIITPDKEYERIRIQLNEFQTARVRLTVVLGNLNTRKKQLEKELSEVNPALLLHQQEIKAFQSELDKLDKEIFEASEMYTDENPKMIAILSRRKAVQKRMDEFLQSKGIKAFDNSLIAKAEKLSAEQKTLLAELETKENEMRVLDSGIADCRKRFRLMTEYQPKLQQLTQQRRMLQDNLTRLEESISEINYMLLMVKEDLFVNEKASAAVGSRPLAKKKLAVCVFAAVAITGFAASLIVLLEFFFGHVANANELKLYSEFAYLGELPASEDMFSSEELENVILNKIFHNFNAMGLHVIFTDILPGGKIIPKLFDFFEWNFGMSGRRLLVMDLVLAEDFPTVPDPETKTMIVTFSKGKAYLPLTSQKFFAPTELELLKNDFQTLKQDYDYIFIRNVFSIRGAGLLMEQITEICDGMIASVGAGKTYRRDLRFLLTVQFKIKLPVMTILTEYSKKNMKKFLNQEAES